MNEVVQVNHCPVHGSLYAHTRAGGHCTKCGWRPVRRAARQEITLIDLLMYEVDEYERQQEAHEARIGAAVAIPHPGNLEAHR